MTSALETFVLGSLSLNDGTKFWVEDVTFTPAQKKPIYAGNSDADGEALVRESHYSNGFIEAQIRVVPKSTYDGAREVLGELTDAIQACERVAGGQSLAWTPAESVRTYTGYALSADYVEVPITETGDLAGWFIKAPVVKVKITLKPFWYLPERTIKAATESAAEPLQVVLVPGVLGDVLAEARLIVKDTATQDRRFAEWGRDVVTSESNPSILLSAKTGLTGTGFSGEAKTRTGAYLEEKVLRGTAVSQATTLCGTGRIENIGSYKVKVRLYATSENARFRISYRNGDGPLIPLEWKEPTVVNGWSEIDMGEVAFDAVTLGTQTSEIRLEQKATTGTAANDVNYFMLWPTTKASGKARGIAVNIATSLLAYDNFEQTEGNLETKIPNFPTSITWAETNKTGASGFKVNAAHYLERSTVSDATLNSGCFAQIGSTSYSTFQSAVTILAGSGIEKEKSRVGLLGRYVSTEKWVIAVVEYGTTDIFGTVLLSVIKNVSGTVTVLGTAVTGLSALGGSLVGGENGPISFYVGANGSWNASCLSASLGGLDSDLSAGGALASGKAGLFDAYTSASAHARKLDGFQLLGAEEPGRVCYSGKLVEFNSQGCLRQDSTGTYDGQPSSYRGGNFFLQPAGNLGLINRVAMRMRRNDVEAEEDSVVSDKQSVEIKVKERFILPR